MEKSALLWIILPIINFFFWFYVSQRQAAFEACESEYQAAMLKIQSEAPVDDTPCPVGTKQNPKCETMVDPKYANPFIEYRDTKKFDKYRSGTGGDLATMDWPDHSKSFVLKIDKDDKCTQYLHEFVSDLWERDQCFAVVRLNNVTVDYPVARFEMDIDDAGYSKTSEEHKKARKKNKNILFVGNAHNQGKLRPTGYFRKVPKERGRARVKEKMLPFLEHFEGDDGIMIQLEAKLSENSLNPGDDIVVMVVNEGEIDLYLNFACSCKMNSIPTNNILVFAASSEIVTMIESTGAMGIYHRGYGAVSKKASMDYLDRVFVDMMWYKAFSIFLLLRLRYNILFQDADLVWFKDPFPYFHEKIEANKKKGKMRGAYLEAFLSDDGQRSLRYAPFYGNSGFYYIVASDRAEHFAWSIMTAFDAVQVLGSHQNVFTTRFVEGLALGHPNVMILPLNDFPTGILYHHDYEYMRKLREHEVEPYNFHMCWTQGKPDKLIYLRKAKMWYLQETCSPLESLTPEGEIFGSVEQKQAHGSEDRWQHLSDMCCTAMPGAP